MARAAFLPLIGIFYGKVTLAAGDTTALAFPETSLASAIPNRWQLLAHAAPEKSTLKN